MSRILRHRPSPSMVVALVALFVAMGGTGYAALTVTGKNVKDSSLTGKDIKDGSVATADVKDGGLLAKDFKAGQLPAGGTGPAGPQGDKGDKGDKGDTGTVDTSNFYTKAGSDGRYLRGTITVVKTISATVAADSYAYTNVDCPAGYQATGGGVDVNQIYSAKVSSSNPTFAGNRTYTVADGQHGPADGWFGAVTTQGTTTSASSAKVAVICAPIG
ncbi:MAG: hypothetical protein QOC55_2081 [Thermoleophilaceae bacterium]|nr:hypothetical protein [Thermoleophilaceae bacterium]